MYFHKRNFISLALLIQFIDPLLESVLASSTTDRVNDFLVISDTEELDEPLHLPKAGVLTVRDLEEADLAPGPMPMSGASPSRTTTPMIHVRPQPRGAKAAQRLSVRATSVHAQRGGGGGKRL